MYLMVNALFYACNVCYVCYVCHSCCTCFIYCVCYGCYVCSVWYVCQVEPPDRKGRAAILNVHIEKQQLPLADDVDVRQLATATSGFTG